ncbi:Rho guanyl-nucleotide exchange factor [Pseudohyphozyma bogoriensis]|nr:Rho guanyl-nucleotide exchange factor [Pseudohyphozyma bogoriensis]
MASNYYSGGRQTAYDGEARQRTDSSNGYSAAPNGIAPSGGAYAHNGGPSWQGQYHQNGQPSYEQQQQGDRDSMASGIISMYGGSSPSSVYGSSGFDLPRTQSDQQQWTQPSQTNASSAAAGNRQQHALRPQYPASTHSSTALPTSASYDYLGSTSQAPYRSPSNPALSNGFEAHRPTATSFHRPTGQQGYDSSSDSSRRPNSNSSNNTTYTDATSPLLNATRGRPSVDSIKGAWTTAPGDAFYPAGGSASPTLSGSTHRQESLEKGATGRARQAVAEAAGGDWRNPVETYSPEEDEAAAYFERDRSTPLPNSSQYSQPTRQPTIMTTPPIGAPPSRTTSLSSQTSTQQTHSTFSKPYSRNGTLSPNTSLGANGFFRSDSGTGSSLNESGGESFMKPELLSHIAVYVKDHVPRGNNVKGALEHPNCFTGEQLVTTILNILPKSADRRYALQIARTLQQNLWFHEVDWSDVPLKDSAGSQAYLFDNAFDSNDFAEIPTGVLTTFTACYSPYCGKLTETGDVMACYSYSCPNAVKNQLHRAPSLLSTSSAIETVEEPDNWVSSVPALVKDSLDKHELQRQLLIFEFIQTEQAYHNDLETIQKGFVEPLLAAQPPIIPPNRIDKFLSDVLLNIDEIRRHSRGLLMGLMDRQKEDYVVSGIGDLVLPAALDWGPAYVQFAKMFPMADALLKEEKAENPRFNEFLMDFHKFSKDTKPGFESFHKRPTFRLLRYNLLLGGIEKNTKEGDQDAAYVKQAMEVLKQQGLEANAGSAEMTSRVECRNYHKSLIKRGTLDLDLLNPERRHFQSSKAWRRSEGTGLGAEFSEGFMILFDNYLVNTKPPREGKHSVARRPFPLELVQLKPSSFSEMGVPRSSGFIHIPSRKFSSTNDNPTSPTPQQDTSASLVYPITLFLLGRNEGIFTFYVESTAVRAAWEQKLREALDLRAQTQEANQVVRIEPLSGQTFGTSVFGSLTPSAPPESQFGRPTCSAPLTFEGRSLVVAGCEKGLFIGFRGDKMRQVVHLAGITQCALLQEFGFVLVLADGALIAYSLEALIPSANSAGDAVRTPQRLSGKQPVLFFRVGRVESNDAPPRTLVIYVKRGGVKESVFKALEPVSAADRASAAGHRFRPFGGNKQPEWFRTYKDFFLPTMVNSVQFLKSKLAIVRVKGVEIMNLETLRTMTVPDFSQVQRDATISALIKKCEESKNLGMFRLQDNLFLLVYDEFAFHVDKEPIAGRLGLLEWESKPEQVAFQSPFIYAFSPNLIEIRNAFTGQLAQIITGSHIALTYDGSAIDSNVVDIRSPSRHYEESRDRRIHFSMRVGSFHTLFEVAPKTPF